MAISETYCDPATGNDYKGATFTDGAFTVADMTLTKAGAFTASKANHWLYLTDNGSNEITDGYYRIASVTSANAVVLATSPKSGANDPTDVKCTQHDGTTSLPWHSVQGALDLITRDATNGDRVNVKAGTADVLSAALSLTTYGTPTTAVPLVIQGYTSAAGDGGIGEINNGGRNVSVFDSSTIPMIFADMKLGNTGTALVLKSGPGSVWANCEIHTSSGVCQLYTPSIMFGCYVHDMSGARGVQLGGGNVNGGAVWYNYFENCATLNSIFIYCNHADVAFNIIRTRSDDTANVAIEAGYGSTHTIHHNICYSRSANTSSAILAYAGCYVLNNIICNWSGAGGEGICLEGSAAILGSNAFYNCTANETISSKFVVRLADNVSLAADPFTDAANGDFSLTAAAKTALAAKGFPTSYLGAHANTDPHITIGPMQYGPTPAAAGGGFPILGGSVVR